MSQLILMLLCSDYDDLQRIIGIPCDEAVFERFWWIEGADNEGDILLRRIFGIAKVGKGLYSAM